MGPAALDGLARRRAGRAPPQLGEDALVEGVEFGERVCGWAPAGGAAMARSSSASLRRLAEDVLDPDPAQGEGGAEAALVGDLGDEAVALQLGQRGRARLPAPLLGQQRGGVGVERRGEQVRAVGRQRVQGRGAEPLGVLVQQHRPQPELGALLKQSAARLPEAAPS